MKIDKLCHAALCSAGQLRLALAAAAIFSFIVLSSYVAPVAAAPGLAYDINEEIECLALTIYFEARGEDDTGKLAVGHVVMNRVMDEKFPSRICDVVRQGGEARYRCQFTWWCDGLSDRPANVTAWQRSAALARRVFWGFSDDPTEGALWYHADYVAPAWESQLSRGPKIGRHIFYHPPVHKGTRVQLAEREDG